MRCTLLAAAFGAFLTVLVGCGSESAPSGPGRSQQRRPVPPPPPPPPPPTAGTAGPSTGGPNAAPAGGAQGYPSFPDAVTEPPAWGDKAPPFDLAGFFAAPPAEQNAAPLYLDALFEFCADVAPLFSPEERKRREPIAKRREAEQLRLVEAQEKDPASVSDAEVDAWLQEHESGFQKLALAQQRPRCVFQTGLSVDSLVPHAVAARQVARVADWRAKRDLARGDFERPIRDVETVLRLSRDLRPRGGIICQLVSVAMDNLCFEQIVPAILATPGIKAEHCDRLLAALRRHEAEGIDRFVDGHRAEYLIARQTLDDLQHRTGIFDPEVIKEELGVREAADSPLTCVRVLMQVGTSAGALASQRWPGLFDRRNPAAAKKAGEEFERQIGSMTPDDYAKEADALNRFYASILALSKGTNLQRLRGCTQPGLVEPLRETKLAVFLEPLTEWHVQAFLRAEATLRGTQCLIALRRWQLDNWELPKELETVVKAAGMPGVPIDPYCDRPLQMTVIGANPVVYSVGKYGRDHKVLIDWEHGQKPGDFIFPSVPPWPEQLARRALEAPDPGQQEVAAVRLADLGKPAGEQLRRLLAESRAPGVRAACIQGLTAQWDYEAMPALLDALDDGSPLVRGRAGVAVEKLLSRKLSDFGYHYDDPPEKRTPAIKRLRQEWEKIRDSEIFEHWKKRLEERG